jgi:hypothetical protein
MNFKSGLYSFIVLSLVLTLLAPVVSAEAPAPIQLPGGAAVSQTYVDVVTYWYKQIFPQDWSTRLDSALNPPIAGNTSTSAHVILTGVPANTWWIDAWRLEFDGTWTNSGSGWSFHVVGQAPNPVHGNLMLQGYLPEAYIVRACEKTGAVLAGGPKLLVVTRTGGEAVTFDLPSLPVPTAEQLASVKM